MRRVGITWLVVLLGCSGAGTDAPNEIASDASAARGGADAGGAGSGEHPVDDDATDGHGGFEREGGPLSNDGGSWPQQTCGEVAHCGGDILGTWDITNSCFAFKPEALHTANCPTASWAFDFKGNGFMIFRRTGTYSSELTLGGTVTVRMPNACVEKSGPCSSLAGLFLSRGEYTRASCTAGRSVCTCVAELKPKFEAEVGTFVTSGSTLITTPAQGSPTTSEYCVDGPTLVIRSTSSSGASTMHLERP